MPWSFLLTALIVFRSGLLTGKKESCASEISRAPRQFRGVFVVGISQKLKLLVPLGGMNGWEAVPFIRNSG